MLASAFPSLATQTRFGWNSAPLLPQPLKIRLRQDCRRHHHPKFDLGVEVEKPGLSEPGYVRGLRDIDNQNATPLAVALSEVSSLRLDVVENLLHRGSSRSISNFRVERLDWAI